MSTIVDKLNLLKNTKERIRLAINEKGVQCSINDKFSLYPDKIKSISSGSDYSLGMLSLDCILFNPTITFKNNVQTYANNGKNIPVNVNFKNVQPASIVVEE